MLLAVEQSIAFALVLIDRLECEILMHKGEAMSLFGSVLECSNTSASCTMDAGTKQEWNLTVRMDCFSTDSRRGIYVKFLTVSRAQYGLHACAPSLTWPYCLVGPMRSAS